MGNNYSTILTLSGLKVSKAYQLLKIRWVINFFGWNIKSYQRSQICLKFRLTLNSRTHVAIFLSYFNFIVVLNTVMNKVLVQTLSNHGGAPVKMLRSSKIHKNATFQLWEEHRYVFKVQHTNYERSDCRSKAAQIFHQWTWVTLALPRAALPSTTLDKICKNWRQKCAKIYSKNCFHQQITQYNTFWDNFTAFSAWSMV